MLLRAYLLAGLIAHKVVWEILKRGAGAPPRQPFRPIKAVKILVLGALLLQPFFPELFPIRTAAFPLQLAGTALYTLGLAVAIAARLQLGRNWSDLESATVLPRQQLVARGLYRYIRHPIYLGDILLIGGYELALNSWGVLLVLPLTAFVWRKAAQEEALLATQLPGYPAYLQTSGRFLPRLTARK